MLKRYPDKQRFYVHEVWAQEENQNKQRAHHSLVSEEISDLNQTSSTAYVNSILDSLRKYKGQSRNNSGIKSSLKTPVEKQRDLIAVHNLDETKLEDALELGGLPGISVAVTQKDIGHSDFGNISLVFGKDSIDPQKNSKNHVYSRDAYTTRRP